MDACFIQSMLKLISVKKTPVLLAIAGPTAAGKTEIVERLSKAFTEAGQQVTSIELDNFLSDRDYREANGIHSEGKRALHFELFKQALEDITQGKKISIPRYDFVSATSSHDIQGNLKPDGIPIEIEPADIIFIEGNFPFLLEEVVHLIDIKVVYLTDDAVRMKRKWKRDIDYRKKYDFNYFRNRFFKDQFIMAQIAYHPTDGSLRSGCRYHWGSHLGNAGIHQAAECSVIRMENKAAMTPHELESYLPLLFEKMKRVCPALEELEFYEFCYALQNLTPKNGWDSINLESPGRTRAHGQQP